MVLNIRTRSVGFENAVRKEGVDVLFRHSRKLG
jgi:hypothetical protein